MKYFVVSDIHGYYEPLVKALAEAGYNQDDPNQTLIVLGDLLDRGNQPREVLAFIQSIDPNRLILVRGNHEDLFKDLLKKEYPDYCDFANRTLMTLFSLAFKSEGYQDQPNKRIYIEVSKGSFKAAVRKIYETGVANLILSDERWRDFVEIGNRIFVHGFYPLGQTPSQSPDEKPTPCYDPNWRNASKEAWERARFTWGHEAIQAGLFEPERRKGKTIIMGHVSASVFHEELSGRTLEDAPIYEENGVVAIDAATYFTQRVNVYVFEEE